MRQNELSENTHKGFVHSPRVYGLGRAIVIELCGEIDLVVYQRLAPLVDAVAAGPEPIVVVDLSEVEFFDCSGISLLIRAHRKVSDRGGLLRVVCAEPLTLRMLRLTHLSARLSPAPTVGAALLTS